jgi:putative N6-adenine-specific DNA methylase
VKPIIVRKTPSSPSASARPGIQAPRARTAGPQETTFEYFASCQWGMDEALGEEASRFIPEFETTKRGIHFWGPLSVGYEACLRLRIASRVFVKIHETPALANPKEYYEHLIGFNWQEHYPLREDLTFAFETTADPDYETGNPQYWSLIAKDALCDHFRQKAGFRPSVSKDNPDFSFRIHLSNQGIFLYLELSNGSLHARGYRRQAKSYREGAAPVRENLAAALIERALFQDPDFFKRGIVYDPFCGSGTLLIESNWILRNRAPSYLQDEFSRPAWRHHDPALFRDLREKVLAAESMPADAPRFVGSDLSDAALQTADRCIQNAEVPEITVSQKDFFETKAESEKGTLIANLPYGERLSVEDDFFKRVGDHLKHHYKGWTAYLLLPMGPPMKTLGLKTSMRFPFKNGDLECRFVKIDLF